MSTGQWSLHVSLLRIFISTEEHLPLPLSSDDWLQRTDERQPVARPVPWHGSVPLGDATLLAALEVLLLSAIGTVGPGLEVGPRGAEASVEHLVPSLRPRPLNETASGHEKESSLSLRDLPHHAECADCNEQIVIIHQVGRTRPLRSSVPT